MKLNSLPAVMKCTLHTQWKEWCVRVTQLQCKISVSNIWTELRNIYNSPFIRCQTVRHVDIWRRSFLVPILTCSTLYVVWSKTMVNAAAECDPTERQGSSVREAARWTLVTVCDKFQLVRCSQSVVSYGWEKVCFKACHKSWITNKALTWNFVSNCKKKC